MTAQTMAAYFCVNPPGWGSPYYCVQSEYPTPYKPCGCPPFTLEPMPLDLIGKLVSVLERNGELLKENAELHAELDALKLQMDKGA